ncbi:MAG: (2Fe-2S)-binding protein [Verrucomicrobiales bacterium]|nr:(2Fe-2S)-binding protein [Verrucomicrobiales bacterium]
MSDQNDAPDVLNVSRRGFLKGLGVGTAATSLLSPVTMREALAAERGAVGPGEVAVSLSVNGQTRQLNVEPRVTLLDALRNRLDLTGPKKVCDRGTCGACTVLVDDKPVYSCSMLALEAEGRKITTVEGIGTPDKMNAVQKAFVTHDAQQCGFCTPGFVTAATAFVRKHPNASIDDVRAGLGGNLCRCGTYAGMILAVADAASGKGGAA